MRPGGGSFVLSNRRYYEMNVPGKLIQVAFGGVDAKASAEMIIPHSDAERLLRQALAHRQDVFPSCPNGYASALFQLKEMLDSGVLGSIHLVQLNCFWKRDGRYYTAGSWQGQREWDRNALYTQFTHYTELLRWLFGDLTQPTTRLLDANRLTESGDHGLVSFTIPNGGRGCLSFSTTAWGSPLENSLTILAGNGSVKISGDYLSNVDYCRIRKHTERIPTH